MPARSALFPRGAAVDPHELDRDAHRQLARLRETEPVSWVASLGCWLVTGHDAAVQVMRDSATYTVDDPRFSTARVVGPSMLSLDGPEHARHRAPFNPPFRPSRVRERFEADVLRLAHGLVDEVEPRGAAELRRELAGPLSVAVVAEVLGLEASDATTVLGWYAAIVDAVTSTGPHDEIPASAGTAMAALSERVLDGARTTGSLLSTAAARLDEQQVVANAAVMMFGGIETTEGMILSAVGHVLTHGVDLRGAGPDLLAAAVEESLRMEPAAAVVDRYATRDVELAGAGIGRGDLVRVSLAGANRDPSVFPDPDAFDPGRPNLRAQLSFARGPHVCIAMDLARLEARTALAVLVDRLPGLRSARPIDVRGLVFRKPTALHVTWD